MFTLNEALKIAGLPPRVTEAKDLSAPAALKLIKSLDLGLNLKSEEPIATGASYITFNVEGGIEDYKQLVPKITKKLGNPAEGPDYPRVGWLNAWLLDNDKMISFTSKDGLTITVATQYGK